MDSNAADPGGESDYHTGLDPMKTTEGPPERITQRGPFLMPLWPRGYTGRGAALCPCYAAMLCYALKKLSKPLTSGNTPVLLCY